YSTADVIISQPAIVPQNGERIACASAAVASARAGRPALVGDHAAGPAAAENGVTGEVMAQLEKSGEAELGELGTELGEGCCAVLGGYLRRGDRHASFLVSGPTGTGARGVPVTPSDA